MTQRAKYECFPGDVTIFHSIHYCIVTLPLPQPITFHRSHGVNFRGQNKGVCCQILKHVLFNDVHDLMTTALSKLKRYRPRTFLGHRRWDLQSLFKLDISKGGKLTLKPWEK